MSKLFFRAALVGCAAAGLATAQPQSPTPPPVILAPPVPVPVTPAPAVEPSPRYTASRPIPTPPPAKTGPGKMVLKTFDVAELVCPPADSPLAKPGTDRAMIAAAKAYTDVRSEELMKAVRADTDRTSWEEYDGPGKLALTTDGKTLVVNCAEATADLIGTRVAALRTAGRSQVRVEMVVFTVPSGNEAMGKVFGGKGAAAVSPDEFNKLLRELKASGAVDVLSHPTLMMLNKQTGFFQVGQACPTAGQPACDSHGITTRVTPVLSGDLKSVVLDLDLSLSRPSNSKGGTDCQQTKTSMVVPDGGTMAVKVCTRDVEHRSENKVPVVGDLPYLGRLFKNIGISSVPTDTVAVVTVHRVLDAPPCVVPPKALAATPPMMPVASPLAAPVPVMLPLPVRTVGGDGLERVGVSFNALTTPPTLPPTPSHGWVVEGQRLALPANATLTWRAPAGVTFTRYLPTDVTLAGGVIGTTLSNDTTSLMAAYKAACAAGRTDEATRLGLQLLAKDPTCFGK